MNSSEALNAGARCRFAAAALVLALGTATVAHAGDPREWLDRMNNAVERLNYEGTFVHMHDGSAETLYIVHRYMDGRVSERVVSLDGPGREIVRHEDEVTSILSDREIVLVGQRKRANPLQAALPAVTDTVDEHYRLELGDEARIAGRAARVLMIAPTDSYRYGFRLWLDSATAMPLKSQMLDEAGDVVEQLLFTSISLPEYIPASALEPVTDTDGFTWYRRDDEAAEAAGESTRSAAWRATEVPDGFRLTAATVGVIAGSRFPVQHLVYSDGIATVSVFVEDAQSDAEWPLGLSRMGGANAYSVRIEGRVVTAVGEVPALTVERIARSVELGDAPVVVNDENR